MAKAVDIGLIPDGVTYAQRAQLDAVLQAALDAHPVLKLGPALIFAGSDLSGFQACTHEDADAVLSNANVKIAFMSPQPGAGVSQ
jgi:hypothetical protein